MKQCLVKFIDITFASRLNHTPICNVRIIALGTQFISFAYPVVNVGHKRRNRDEQKWIIAYIQINKTNQSKEQHNRKCQKVLELY